MYDLSLNCSGTDIKKRKPTVWSGQKVNRLNVRLSGSVCFEKYLSSEDSSFVPSNEEKSEEGISICNGYRTSDEEEGRTLDEEGFYEEEVGNYGEVADAVVIRRGSEGEIGVEEELERSGMGRDEILEYMQEICKCCFSLYSIVFYN